MTEIPPELELYAEINRGLHSAWQPHMGQAHVGQAIFRNLLQSIWVQCGRKWGKTELALYVLWRIAKTYPGVPCYYIAPLQTQAKEIVWADPRVKNFGPREWLLPGSAGVNNTELRLNFTNGSFIKVDGSDNYEKYRGPRYKICVYEEYKDHRPEFYRGMRPNASVLGGIDLFIGTPPDRECDYTMLAREHKNDPTKFYHEAPSWENPHIDRKWLAKEKKQLYDRGEGDVWEREYGARFVPGGATKIFPMVSNHQHVFPHQQLIREISRDLKKLEWFLITDPAASTVFGALFLALNPYSRVWYVLGELYETQQSEMTVKRIGSRLFQTRDELWPREWMQVYDEAETWFANEMLSEFEESFHPTHKALKTKEQGITLLRDTMLESKLRISDRCVKLFWELDNYFKDKNGNIPKKNDHLIDCLRYAQGAAYYTLNETKEFKEADDEMFRGARISDDFPGLDDLGERIEFEDVLL